MWLRLLVELQARRIVQLEAAVQHHDPVTRIFRPDVRR
jgi:hypothetical protein